MTRNESFEDFLATIIQAGHVAQKTSAEIASEIMDALEEYSPKSNYNAGLGWRFLSEGEPLQKGDGYIHPDFGTTWIDFESRPAIFRGPEKEFAHLWPWRRRIEAKK